MNLNEQKEKLRMELPNGMLKKLDDFFHGGEEILYSFKGAFATHSRWTDSSVRTSSRLLNSGKVEGTGTQWGSPWLILTNQRLLIVGKGMFTLDTREIPYEHIKSIDYEQGFLQDRITILAHSSTEAIQFYSSDRKYTKKFPALIKEQISKNTKSNNSPKEDIPAQIEKLAQLLEKKILTKK